MEFLEGGGEREEIHSKKLIKFESNEMHHKGSLWIFVHNFGIFAMTGIHFWYKHTHTEIQIFSFINVDGIMI